jgi:Arm DNA-binding domain
MLSDKQVKALKSTGKDVFKSDGGGLYLRVSIHGTKTFIYRKKSNGITRYTTVGECPRKPPVRTVASDGVRQAQPPRASKVCRASSTRRTRGGNMDREGTIALIGMAAGRRPCKTSTSSPRASSSATM